jgi:hypothetical protein
MGVVLTPLAHRMMHKFHLENKDREKSVAKTNGKVE